MTISFGIFTFIIAWWITLLPVMSATAIYSQDKGELDYAAAPKTIRWKKALIITSALALAETILLALIIKSGIVSLKNLI